MMRYLATILFLIGFVSFQNAKAQGTSYTLTGMVKGVDNQPLENVTISVLGSSQTPAVSDEKGTYQIKLESGNVWLSFNPVGNLFPKTIFVDGRTVLNVYLFDNEIYTAYEEAVMEEKNILSRDVISAHQNITEKQMNISNSLSADQLLQTSFGGAYVTNMSGMPLSGTSTFLRGVGSINAGNEPLYVVDGVPLERANNYTSLFNGYNYNPISMIDPFDISQITVYKDPAYTSKYGVYGANGVVEIRTIDPNQNKTTINVKFRTGITTQPDQLPQLNNTQYKSLANEILFSSGMLQEDYKLKYPGIYLTPNDGKEYAPYQHNTNWQDEVFQDAKFQNVHFSIKGGDAIANYGMTFGYLTSESLFKGTSASRFNTRFVSNFNVIERIKMAVNVNLVNTTSDIRESALESQRSPILSGLWKSPILSPFNYDDDGNQTDVTASLDELGVSNPNALAHGLKSINENFRFSTSAKIIGEISKSLKLTTLIGANYNTMTESLFSPDLGMDYYLEGEAYNESAKSSNSYMGIYSNTYLSYFKALDKNSEHKLSAMLGMRLKIDDFQNDFGTTRNTPSDDYTSLASGVDKLSELGGNNLAYRCLSFYSDVNYTYRGKYIVNLKLSADASSSIGKDAVTPFSIAKVPFSDFYSVGGAWRVSSEDFLRNVNLIEELKLRASYGTSGSDNFSVLLSRPYLMTAHYNAVGVAIPGNLANTALKNETRSMYNFGFDLALQGGRYQLTVDLYNSKTKDALIYYELPAYAGESYFPVNGGTIGNKGGEISLTSRMIDRKDFQFDMGLNLGMYSNKVMELPSDKMIVSLPGDGEMLTQIGSPVNCFYGYHYEGVYASIQESDEAGLVNFRGEAYSAGDAKFKDISGPKGKPDGIIDNYDKTILGSPNPDLVGTFNLRIAYKGWSLKAVSQFVLGQEIYNYIRYQNEKMTDLHNQSAKVLQRWTHEGQITDVPRAEWNDPMGNSSFSSRWIEDGSYLRLKELTLSYHTSKKISILRDLEVYATVSNLLTWTNYLGYDPEMSYSYSPYLQGIDYGLMPQSRTFMLGINIGL